MRLGIAAKLALLLALVGALAAGLTGFYAYAASRDLLVESAKNKLLTSTQVLARRITLTREEISRNLQVLAGHPAALSTLQRADAARDEQLATLFSLVMRANPAYSQLRLISAADFGLERVRVDRRDELPLRVQGDDLQEKGHYAYVAETLKLPAGATYLSRITVNHEGGNHAGLDQPVLQLAMPVTDATGLAVGVVVVNVDLDDLFALLAADLPGSFKLFMANGAGDILIHPDSSRTFGFDKGRRVLIQDEFAPTGAVVEGRQDQVVFEARDGDHAGVPVVAAFIEHWVKVPSDENRLLLGLAQPLADVLAQSRQLGTAILQIVVGLCLACLLLAVLLARAFTRPIDAVSAAAQRFAAGQPPGKLPLARQDEIGTLARSFQQMHQQITRQLANLQVNQVQLEHLAQHDTLTGLPNRRLFQDRLEQALAHAHRYGAEVSVLFIDLDEFKTINDELGHDAGDAALKAVAERLLAMVREADTVARLGGDEFVVLLSTPTPPTSLGAIAEKLLSGIRAPVDFQGSALQVSASIGISCYPHDGQTAGEILANADQAMYEAKAAGRANFQFFSAPPAAETS
ncbi:diguanylate cyclase domain-containing protein [Methylibium sp.]|uniref:diguanylate cyclase domain-containing protein n=1 Tax=Methylibium sp. TaxID=2067992 RepID=UPI003D12286A